MQISRGDVVRILFPNSDLVTSKRRPAIVVQADALNTGLPQILLAMITSNPRRAGHPSRVVIDLSSQEAQRSGLRLDSIVMTDNIVTVHENEIDSKLGFLSDMEQVDDALAHTFGLRIATRDKR